MTLDEELGTSRDGHPGDQFNPGNLSVGLSGGLGSVSSSTYEKMGAIKQAGVTMVRCGDLRYKKCKKINQCY